MLTQDQLDVITGVIRAADDIRRELPPMASRTQHDRLCAIADRLESLAKLQSSICNGTADGAPCQCEAESVVVSRTLHCGKK